MADAAAGSTIVDRYLELGLRLGRHVDGFVDAYYGPAPVAARVESEPVLPPAQLSADAGGLIADLDAGVDAVTLDASRRRWLRAQVVGLHTSARKLAGEPIGYADEVEWCYGVRPTFRDEEAFAAAHHRLDEALPGSGAIRDRVIAWREAQAIPVETLEPALRSLADDFRERTQRLFGLPDGEQVHWELAHDQPWSGFNYYEGDLRSRVAINTDLPVLSTSIAHLVAHEAYPGHHTEHSRKEAGLVRRRGWQEETIFLVGTPQCLLAEGLADLALEVIAGESPEQVVAEHLRPLGIAYDPEVVAAVRTASESLDAVRANAAWLLHADGAPVDDVVAYLERWGLQPRARATKSVEFLTSETWRAYISCYVEGLPLCRAYVAGDPARFATLLTEQLVPADLAAAVA
jgi:hypothetical protein